MSGGNFDYLFSRFDNNLWDGFWSMVDDLDSMADWLLEQGQSEAAVELWSLWARLRVGQKWMEAATTPLLRIMKGAEWWCSHDWGEDDFVEEWQAWKAGDRRWPY